MERKTYFEEVFEALEGCDYVVVGGLASLLRGNPYASFDLTLAVLDSLDNQTTIRRILDDLGFLAEGRKAVHVFLLSAGPFAELSSKAKEGRLGMTRILIAPSDNPFVLDRERLFQWWVPLDPLEKLRGLEEVQRFHARALDAGLAIPFSAHE